MAKTARHPVVSPLWTKLHWAAWRGDAGALSALLERGCDLQVRDVDGWTALHCAAAGGDPGGECVKLLAAAGARVDSRGSSGVTALHVAAGRSNEAAMTALLAAGASGHIVDHEDRKPVDYATSDCIKYLLNPESE